MKQVTPEQFTKEIERELEQLSREIVDESQKRIIQNAPSNTGALRASIRVGVNREVVEYSPDRTDPDGQTTISLNSDEIKSAKLGDVINITVGAPYGFEVENGSSEKAPTGFVRVVAEELDSIVQAAAGKVGGIG